VAQSPTPLLLASAARTAAINTPDQKNVTNKWRGVHLYIDITADPSSAVVTFTIEGKDPRTATYYPLLVSADLAATGFVVLKIYPGIIVVADLAANDVLPHEWRVSVAVADTDSMTYSISASLLR